MIKAISYPRAALFGNPSDGFGGKTIAFPFTNFHVESFLEPAETIQLASHTFKNVEQFLESYPRFLHHEDRLLFAAVKRFLNYLAINSPKNRPHTGFHIDFQTSIPRQLGLAGSTAIIISVWKVLSKFFNIPIPPTILAQEALAVETDELGITAGLQDRVVLAHQASMYMDFSSMEFKRIDLNKIDNIYIAYDVTANEESGKSHFNLRSEFEQGNEKVIAAMNELAQLTAIAHKLIDDGTPNHENLKTLIDRNFDIRASIMPISPKNMQMITQARKFGASAKFTGSGGAIVGSYQDESMYLELSSRFERIGVKTLKPGII